MVINMINKPLRSLKGLMLTNETIIGTCVGEVERGDQKQLCWVSLVKGSKVGTLDGMFNSDELRAIADFMERKSK